MTTIKDVKTGLAWLDRAHEQARGYTPAHALPPLPGEHTEAVELDLATKSGAIVVLGGRVTVWEPSRTIFVGVTYSSTLTRADASSALLGAVRDGRIGSDVVRAAVERGFALRGYGEVAS